MLSFYRSSLTSVPHLFVFVKHFFELFLNSFFCNSSVFVDSFHSITPKSPSVNTFFQLFFTLFFKPFRNIILLYQSLFLLPYLVEPVLNFFKFFYKEKQEYPCPRNNTLVSDCSFYNNYFMFVLYYRRNRFSIFPFLTSAPNEQQIRQVHPLSKSQPDCP